MIEEWQKRAVRLDRNQRQSRVEKRMLGKNMVHLQGNAQPSRGFREGLYEGRRGQIVQRADSQNFRERAQNNWREQGLGRDLNAIDINRGKGGQDMLYI